MLWKLNKMEDLIIRNATIDDLLDIQKLNKILFELELKEERRIEAFLKK